MKILIKKCIAILAIANLILSISSPNYILFVHAAEETITSKIDPNTYELAEKEEGRYLVYIFRKSIDTATIDNELENIGIDINIYNNKKLYNESKAKEIERYAINKYGKDIAFSPSEKARACGETATIIEDLIRDDYKQYIITRRSIIKDLYNVDIDRFISDNSIDDEFIKYRGDYTGTLILCATKDEIQQYICDPSVTEIAPYVQREFKNELAFTNGQIKTDRISGTKSNYYNNGSGYTGYGVDIGVIEYEGKYDENFPQLSGSSVNFIPNIREDNTEAPYEVNNHATLVTSIIVGKQKMYNGYKFEGVAPNANVYQMPVETEEDFYNAFSYLASLGVSIINFSAGVNTGGSYDSFDKETDKYISQTGVTFIKSAGNTYSNITSPGKAYGAVTVGALDTKSANTTQRVPPYSVADFSAYYTNSGMTNKPDICAPGVIISAVGYSGTLLSDSGTSFAAPHVTGLAAQIHQCDPDCLLDPVLTKALLILGASNSNITSTNNGTSGNPFLRARSGAGIIDAVKSIEVVSDWNCSSQNIILQTATEWENVDEQYVWLNSGDTIRIVTTFNKCDNSNISTSGYRNDIDLYIRKAYGGYFLSSSVSETNNVEIIEYTATESATYKIEVELYDFVCDGLTYAPLKVATAWMVY